MKIIFIEEAKLETDDAFLYYELEQPTLGTLFKQELKRLVDILMKYPQIGTQENYGLKSLLLHKFPYKIIYHVSETEILILSVAHQHRKPEYWSERM